MAIGIKKSNLAWSMAVKHEILGYVREIAANYGGDDPQFLRDYVAEVVKIWESDLKKAQECFLALVKQSRVLRFHGRKQVDEARQKMEG